MSAVNQTKCRRPSPAHARVVALLCSCPPPPLPALLFTSWTGAAAWPASADSSPRATSSSPRAAMPLLRCRPGSSRRAEASRRLAPVAPPPGKKPVALEPFAIKLRARTAALGHPPMMMSSIPCCRGRKGATKTTTTSYLASARRGEG